MHLMRGGVEARNGVSPLDEGPDCSDNPSEERLTRYDCRYLDLLFLTGFSSIISAMLLMQEYVSMNLE